MMERHYNEELEKAQKEAEEAKKEAERAKEEVAHLQSEMKKQKKELEKKLAKCESTLEEREIELQQLEKREDKIKSSKMKYVGKYHEAQNIIYGLQCRIRKYFLSFIYFIFLSRQAEKWQKGGDGR